MQRIQTGIKNVDKLLDGGFPKNSNILISGVPGSGKTIFGLEFLYRGATEFKENGLFVTLEQTQKSLIEQADSLGFNFKKLISNNQIHILYIPVDQMNRDFGQEIKNIAKKNNVSRIVFDSLSLLAINSTFIQDNKFSLADGKNLKVSFNLSQFIFNFINMFEEIDATTLIIKNLEPEKREEDIVSEYVCDGVISLRSMSMGKIRSRTLEITKMRKTSCDNGIYSLKIKKGGLEVL